MAKTRQIILELDEDDYDAIQAEVARRQAVRWPSGNESPGLIDVAGPPKSGPILPDGESNTVGSILAEVVRDLEDYRAMFDATHPRG
jgi:hypothetical protein